MHIIDGRVFSFLSLFAVKGAIPGPVFSVLQTLLCEGLMICPKPQLSPAVPSPFVE